MSDQSTGLFIVLEGIDGAGKTSQAALLAERLTGAGHRVLLTREPGGSAAAERIRTVLLASGEVAATITPETEALLFAAARASHVHHVIRPALLRGDIVVCDRYELSTLAYQGAGRGLDTQQLINISTWATNALIPDLTILLDLDVPTAMSRSRHRDRFDQEGVDFFSRVRAGFLDHVARQPFAVVDAGNPAEHVAALIGELVDDFIAERSRK